MHMLWPIKGVFQKSSLVNTINTLPKTKKGKYTALTEAHKLELELIQTQMAQKPMLRAEVGMRVRCANKASAE